LGLIVADRFPLFLREQIREGITAEEIAKACKCHVSSVRKWSQGRRLPNLNYALDIFFLVASKTGKPIEAVIVDGLIERDKGQTTKT
jgi:transcriptional regulator with XRE-family HTH domain|tara:strand:- start:1279 stop:1539 length:261 start_codon:yes stop_codon:yes gene_type:complete